MKKQTKILISVVIIAVIAMVAVVYYLTLPPPREEILIGAAISQTGGYGPSGRLVVEGYRLWERHVNENGGILGLPVRLVLYDDRSDPTTTKTLYEKLITIDGVDLLLGPYSSSCGLTAAPVAEKYRKVLLQPINNAKTLYTQGHEYTFLIYNCGTTDLSLTSFFKWLATLDPRPETIAAVNTADLYPRGLVERIEDYCTEYDLELVYSGEVPAGVLDLTITVTEIKATNPDVFLVVGYFSEETLFVSTAKALDFYPKVFACTVSSGQRDFWDTLGEDAIGVLYVSAAFTPKLPYPKSQAFVEAFSEEYGVDPDDYSGCGYATGEILQAAIEGVGSVDDEKIRDWLLTHQVDTVIGPWEVDHDMAELDYKYVPVVHTKVEQWMSTGEKEIIYPPDAATAEAIYPRSSSS